MSSSATMLQPRGFLEKARGCIGFGILAPFILLTIFSRPPLHDGSWSEVLLDILGWMLFVAGAGVRFWATLYIGGRKGGTMMMEGPYSICRNPLYMGTFLLLLAMGCFLENLTFFLGAAISAAAYLGWVVRSEEARLSHRFGQTYQDYCKRVPRFFPRFSSFQTSNTITVDARALIREARTAAIWVWLPLVCEVSTRLRASEDIFWIFGSP